MNESATARLPRSRRERPAKPALSRQAVIAAALAILDEEGLGKVTMRRIAAALDTGHASLYVYVRDTEDLHAQVLDDRLGSVVASAATTGGWRDQLIGLLTQFQAVLLRYPALARMTMSTQPDGPNYAALVEKVLALLRAGGVVDQAAAWGVDLLLLYPVAVVVEHTPSRPDVKRADPAVRTEQIARIDAVQHPNIAELRVELLSGDGAARSVWALNVLIDGLLAAPGPTFEPPTSQPLTSQPPTYWRPASQHPTPQV